MTRGLVESISADAGGNATGSTETSSQSSGGVSDATATLDGGYNADSTTIPEVKPTGVSGSIDSSLSVSAGATSVASGNETDVISQGAATGSTADGYNATLVQILGSTMTNGTTSTKGTKGTKGTGDDIAINTTNPATIATSTYQYSTTTGQATGGAIIAGGNGTGSGTGSFDGSSTVDVAATVANMSTAGSTASNLVGNASGTVVGAATYTVQSGVPVCGTFTSIADVGTDLLTTFDSTVLPQSPFYTLNEGVTPSIPLGFTFKPFGLGPGYTTITVNTNGSIYFGEPILPQLNNGIYPIVAAPLAADPETFPRISVVQSDLDLSNNGSVFVYNTGSSFIVSYEDADFFGLGITRVNAQVELFPTGAFEIRWGDITQTINFSAGIEDETLLGLHSNPAMPAVLGDFFDAQGVTSGGIVPSNQCTAFELPSTEDLPGASIPLDTTAAAGGATEGSSTASGSSQFFSNSTV